MNEEIQRSNDQEAKIVPLEEVLIALQKSFSRVSKSSFDFAKENEGSTVALMVGNIDFEVSLKADIQGDRILYNQHGAMTLNFKGQIDPDHKEDIDQEPINT